MTPRFIQIVAASASSQYYYPSELYGLTSDGLVYQWVRDTDKKGHWRICEKFNRKPTP
jgi:hypothetical protein